MSIDPLDRPHDQQPVPGQDQNPGQLPDPDFITDNPDVGPGPGDGDGPVDRPVTGPDVLDPGLPGTDGDSVEVGPGNPLP